MSNLIKSDAAWKRFRERTNAGAVARRATMESRPSVAKKRREQRAKSKS